MRFHFGLGALRRFPKGSVVTIGNYDGVHLGHRAVLRELCRVAKLHRLPAVALVFEPQPQEFFRKDRAPARLSGLRDKVLLLADAGVAHLVCLRFNHRLAALSAAQFAERVLVRGLSARAVVVGDDFRFGQGREGDFESLRALGVRLGFEAVPVPGYTLDGERVSSTRIRALLSAGDLTAARRLSGHAVSIAGHVVRGEQLGRQLGHATINLALRGRVAPLQGVFAARLHGLGAETLAGVAYIGPRPVLEIHLFDFHTECYGRIVRVELLERLRGDRRFDDRSALREQIARDAAQARAVLGLAAPRRRRASVS
ncbi:MAG: bifunctional riboflavin kinase/FAD synthetase [Gammaproteobacteria bacterium]